MPGITARARLSSVMESVALRLNQAGGRDVTNTAIVRNANGLPATFVGSKTGQDDAPFVFVKVGDEERRMRWAEWDALPAWTGPRPARAAKD
ncbi:MAG TPA: hypothetical protein VK788_00990 [Terriglobales bacterium]|jgi:hypothetical protein|nr:hypothetical protein [Terriglobales bacterium]